MNFLQIVTQSNHYVGKLLPFLTIFEKSLMYLISRPDKYLILNGEKSVKTHKYVEFQEVIYTEELEQIEK